MANQNKSKFIRVKCPKCKTSHIIFGKSSTRVKCLKCPNTTLALPSGGNAKLHSRVEEVL